MAGQVVHPKPGRRASPWEGFQGSTPAPKLIPCPYSPLLLLIGVHEIRLQGPASELAAPGLPCHQRSSTAGPGDPAHQIRVSSASDALDLFSNRSGKTEISPFLGALWGLRVSTLDESL